MDGKQGEKERENKRGGGRKLVVGWYEEKERGNKRRDWSVGQKETERVRERDRRGGGCAKECRRREGEEGTRGRRCVQGVQMGV